MPHYVGSYSFRIPKAIRSFGAKLFFAYVGEDVDIGKKCRFSSRLYLGDRSGIGDHAYIQGEVHIGSDVIMAPEVTLIATNHRFDRYDIPIKRQGCDEKPILIGNNCWLCYRATILPGVHVGDNCIIGAGAVVTKNIPSNSLVAGNPGKVIRKIYDN